MSINDLRDETKEVKLLVKKISFLKTSPCPPIVHLPTVDKKDRSPTNNTSRGKSVFNCVTQLPSLDSPCYLFSQRKFDVIKTKKKTIKKKRVFNIFLKWATRDIRKTTKNWEQEKLKREDQVTKQIHVFVFLSPPIMSFSFLCKYEDKRQLESGHRCWSPAAFKIREHEEKKGRRKYKKFDLLEIQMTIVVNSAAVTTSRLVSLFFLRGVPSVCVCFVCRMSTH